jgi:hypothetical protein
MGFETKLEVATVFGLFDRVCSWFAQTFFCIKQDCEQYYNLSRNRKI